MKFVHHYICRGCYHHWKKECREVPKHEQDLIERCSHCGAEEFPMETKQEDENGNENQISF